MVDGLRHPTQLSHGIIHTDEVGIQKAKRTGWIPIFIGME